MKLTETMTAAKIKAYAAEKDDVCTLEAYKAHFILTEYTGSPRGDAVTVTVFICDDVRNHRNPDNERYAQQFDVTGDDKDALIRKAKREIDTHVGARRVCR